MERFGKFGKLKSEPKFEGNLLFELGNGNSIMFWEDIWIRDIFLKDTFPGFYLLFPSKDTVVASMGCWDGRVWKKGNFGLGTGLSLEVVSDAQNLNLQLSSTDPIWV